MRISDWSSDVCSSDLPAQQPELQRLVDRLGLQTVQQHEAGEMLIERSRTYPPHRVEGFLSEPPAMRLAGGMGALVQALQGRQPADRAVSGHRVNRVRQHGDSIEVETQDGLGLAGSYHVPHLDRKGVVLGEGVS